MAFGDAGGDLVAATGPALSAFQPSQRHVVLDERHAAADDPRLRDLTRAVLLLEQSRSAADLANAARLLSRRLGASGGGRAELRQAFADWLGILARRWKATRSRNVRLAARVWRR